MREMQRIYLQKTEAIEFGFYQNKTDFIVEEIPLKQFGQKGNYLILHVEKVELTTWDMIAAFAAFLNIEAQKIGYAGLKDKHATTSQYISIERKFQRELKRFKHPQIKILESFFDTNSLQMGDLYGNRFRINLYDIDDIKAGRIEKQIRKIEKNGMANYFGFQRFGRDADAIEQAKAMVEGELFVTDAKLKKFLLSVYQSERFNSWLFERISLSKEAEFALFEGDVYLKDSKLVTPKEIPTKEFRAKRVIPTGLLCGRNVFRARYKAREIEKKYDDEYFVEKGSRREAIVYPQNIQTLYKREFGVLQLSFELPKAAYATVFLENISGRNLNAGDVKKS